ncbi:NUDIX hydrolase [Lacrimispora sp. JR3]|uniref:NUDIX hydrolase n=1 Tax=Lacrimispora sinapis TaxID=3111456 RepID=UPI003747CF6B
MCGKIYRNRIKQKEAVTLKKKRLSGRRPGIIGEESFRKYAVLVPVIDIDGTAHLLFEKRSPQLRHQPGEICFPGGKLESGETLKACAVRETVEELKVLSDQIKVIGPGDIYLSPFQLMIHSFIGTIKEYQDTFSTDEVEAIIKVPLEFFKTNPPKTYILRLVQEPPENFPYEWIPGGEEYPWIKGNHEILFYQYGNITIWGMTAQIAKSAVELMEEYHIG